MISAKRKIGDIGEDIACEYLIKNGYRILERNHRERFGEIDVIAKAKDGTIVFMEVKTMKEARSGTGIIPEDNMSSAKIRKTRKICEAFANVHQELIDERRGWRIDLIAITLGDGLIPLETEARCAPSRSLTGLTKNKKDCEIKHYENIS